MPWLVIPLPYTEHNGVRIYSTPNDKGGGFHRYRFSTLMYDEGDERYRFDVRALPLESVRKLEQADWPNEWDEDRAILDIIHEAIDRGLLRESAFPLSGFPHA
jgi:hypothetical protein